MRPTSTSLKNTPHGHVRQLEPNKVYHGVVESAGPQPNTCHVRVDEGHVLVRDCQWGAGIVSGMFGMKTNYLPPPNTPVTLVYIPGNPIVIGSTAGATPPAAGANSRSLTGQQGKMQRDQRKTWQGSSTGPRNIGSTPAADLLEGELEISNLMGVGLALLTGLARLSAGDLAKVECCLLNDMVRIVSQNFKHFSALGNFEIYNDGRLNARWEGTSYDHEAWGKATAQEKKTELDEVEVKLGNIDALEDTLRTRFSQFVGFLGDFVNTYVTDPAKALGEAAQARSGKFRCHVNNDGTLLVQSVADIVLERVVRIPVPIERKRWDDPTGNRAEDFATLERGPLKAWKYDPNPDNIFHAAYQLRHYARWLSGLHGLARFHQLGQDWEVPTEAATPEPLRDSGEEDKTAENEPLAQDYIETYATIRIMRDGAIVVLDGYGSGALFAGGNVQLSAAKHLTLEAAGNVNIVAGQNIHLKARRSIELAAITGGLVLKARAWLRAFCELGSIWLRTDAPDPAGDGYVAPAAANPDEDPAPVVLPAAVVIQAPKGRFAIESGNALDLTTKNVSLPDGEMAAINLTAPDGRIKARAFDAVELASRTGDVTLRAGRHVVAAGLRFLNYLSAGVFDVNNTFTVRPGGLLDAARIRTKQLASLVVFSRKLRTGTPPHENHVLAIPAGQETSETYSPYHYGDGAGDDAAAAEAAKAAYNDVALNPPRPATDASGNRQPALTGDTAGELLETVTQQQLRLEPDSDNYGTWNWSGDGLQGAMASNQGHPWPGPAPKDLRLPAGPALGAPSAAAYKDLANSAPALQKKDKQFKFLKQASL